MIDLIHSLLGETPWDIFVQLLGITAMVCIILSFQFKKNTGYFTMQAIGCGLFTLHYALAGLWAGVLMDGLGMCRVLILLMGPRVHKNWVLVLMLAAFTGATVWTVASGADNWLAVFPFISQVANTLGNWSGDPKKIRILQFGIISPGWLVYNIFKTPMSVGGVVCEVFNMASVIVYFIRMYFLKKQGKDTSAV